MATSTEKPDSSKAAIFDDFVDVVASPSRVFERRQDGRFGMQLLLLTSIAIGLFLIFRNAMEPIFDAEFSRNAQKIMEKNPNMNPDQLETMRNMGSKFAVVGFAIFFPISVLITGLVLWVAGKAFDAKESLKQAIQIATLSQVPVLFAQIVGALQALLLPVDKLTSQYSISLSLARFFDPDTANVGLIGLLGRLDLFGLWIIVLMGIGLSIVGRIDRPKAWAAAAIAWVVAILPVLLPAMLRG